MKRKIVAATNNAHKLAEIKSILQDKFDVISLDEAGIRCDPQENGETFLHNALIKAHAAAEFTPLPVLADDTGLCVDALDGAPGVNSARFAGDHDDAANRKKLLELLKGKNRKAHFTCVVALLYPDGKILCATGEAHGRILEEQRGEGGFGYDSLFFSDDLGKTFAEATEEEKNSVSHRGNALKNLLQMLH